jgi:hypothetical protein
MAQLHFEGARIEGAKAYIWSSWELAEGHIALDEILWKNWAWNFKAL